MKRLVLPEMTWPELNDYLKEVQLGLIPVGSQEQHGPNLTFSTDADRAYEMSKLICERLFPKVVTCAPVNFGVSYHHMGFPGTITLQPETLINTLIDIAASFKHHGINNILMVNAHGGNRSSLAIAAIKMEQQLNIKAAYTGSGTDMCNDLLDKVGVRRPIGHACEGEVSQSMYIAPWLVREDSLAPGDIKDTPYQRRKWWGHVHWAFDHITGNGALGDATKASKELGKEMTDLILQRIVDFIEEYYFGLPKD